MKTPIAQEKYANIITSLVGVAITHTEGVASDEAFIGNPRKKTSGNVTLFFDEDETISIDIYVNVVFGYSIADISCILQEKIINDVKENTGLTVKKVNVIVNGVIFN